MIMRKFLPVIFAAAFLAACSAEEPQESADGIPLQQALGAGGAEYRQVISPRDFVFPRDHAAHDGFRTEWWHLIGTLQAEKTGENFGFQLSLFRIAPSPPQKETPPKNPRSNWRATHIWMAHAALTDARGRRHYADERFAREALGLAGATSQPLSVRVGDWEISARGANFPGRARVVAEDFSFDLSFAPQNKNRAPTLQGDAGLSKKGAAPGEASYYYSLMRLSASGELQVGGKTFRASGLAWLDREWSSKPLAAGLSGWDWFALHLNDGADLMFYQLRDGDGNSDSHSAGVLADESGAETRLTSRDVILRPLRFSKTGERYPLTWEMQIPPLGKNWTIHAVVDDQKMDVSVRYWEGMVEVKNASGKVVGRGYMEMTGYE
ncbi:MAG: carotenoid 1,2-hydratase [Gammaproteobacteria bacterium]|nr:carotenoid 1,2-hydratase [Gammaproteobacteria bacterium]